MEATENLGNSNPYTINEFYKVYIFPGFPFKEKTLWLVSMSFIEKIKIIYCTFSHPYQLKSLPKLSFYFFL